jgi:hypothetical protein
MAKEKQEKRYRAKHTLRHGLLGCIIEPGEDVNVDLTKPDGTRWKRYPDEIQKLVDGGYVELYFAPTGTPHVVHSRGKREHVDVETGKHSEVMEYSEAAQQWAGESAFIDAYVEQSTVELPQVKE